MARLTGVYGFDSIVIEWSSCTHWMELLLFVTLLLKGLHAKGIGEKIISGCRPGRGRLDQHFGSVGMGWGGLGRN